MSLDGKNTTMTRQPRHEAVGKDHNIIGVCVGLVEGRIATYQWIVMWISTSTPAGNDIDVGRSMY